MATKTEFVAQFELEGDASENAMVLERVDTWVAEGMDRTVAWVHARWEWPSLVALRVVERIIHERNKR